MGLPNKRGRSSLGPFIIYLTLSLLFFGRGLVGPRTPDVLGKPDGNEDSEAEMNIRQKPSACRVI